MAGGESQVMDIDRDGIVRIGERINGAQSEFRKLAGELQSQLAGMRRDWQGEGGSAFGRLMVEWQQRQEQITRLLQGFEDSLLRTQKSSAGQDGAQASSMFALNQHLNH